MSKKPKKMGRPKIPIDFDVVRGMCSVMATEEEIACYFGCTIQTINERCKNEMGCTFLELFKKNSVGGKISLRRSQFKLAVGGNPSLNIWLGKQYLGQRDQPGDGDETMRPTPVSVSIQVENAD